MSRAARRLQLHGILKADVREVIRQINAVHLSTLAACGDVNRNVMCCPAPHHAPVYQRHPGVGPAAGGPFCTAHGALPRHLAARSGHRAINSSSVAGRAMPEDEPIYGRTYLPRKFKMGIALPHDNCIDVYTHDLGLLAIVEQDRVWWATTCWSGAAWV